jgi:hypothetical protein
LVVFLVAEKMTEKGSLSKRDQNFREEPQKQQLHLLDDLGAILHDKVDISIDAALVVAVLS